MARRSSLFCCLLFIAFAFARINGSAGEEKVGIYKLQKGDFSLKFTNYGATLLSFILPDKNGKKDDVVLSFDSVKDYLNDTTYFGNLVGRVANRIGGAQFTLNGVQYKLVANEGKNILHGGHRGFGDVIWTVKSYKKDSHITFTYDSFDGEQGFPGDLSIAVTYMLIGTNMYGVKMEAKAHNKATPVNLAQHAYWNLNGHASGDILSHKIQIFGSKITPVDDQLIPTGEIKSIEGTPYDFLQPHSIGSRINDLPNGYDINYVLDKTSRLHLNKVAEVEADVSGRKMQLWSNQPGLQFYTSNKLDNVAGKDGAIYSLHAGLCLETQGFPDSVNHPNFPSQIVNPGETYRHVMVYKFNLHPDNRSYT